MFDKFISTERKQISALLVLIKIKSNNKKKENKSEEFAKIMKNVSQC